MMKQMNDAQLPPDRSIEHGNPLDEFNYGSVAFAAGIHQRQLDQTHSVLMDLDEDSLLKPFRARAGFSAPGAELGGWYSSYGFAPAHTFGQWISALSRYYAITGDERARAKVHRLVDEFAATVEPTGKFYRKYQHLAYSFDLLTCGLIDAHHFARQPAALGALTASARVASLYLPGKAVAMRLIRNADPDEHCLDHNYVIPENQFIAWQRGGDDFHLRMAQQYIFDEFFDPLSRGENVLGGLHAYTHVNALSSAAKAFLVLGDEKYLRAAKNGFAYVDEQSYVTGGWGPSELFVPFPGNAEYNLPAYENLGDSLGKTRSGFETPCGAYAHFKLTRYLLRITKDSRYGDSMERVMYNTVLGAKPLQRDGRAFYNSNYGPGARKAYYTGVPGFAAAEWPCCSGTLPQVAADYRISAYFKDKSGIYVNLYIPSTLRWQQRGSDISLSQSGQYPLNDIVTLDLSAAKPQSFSIRLRIPAWAKNPCVRVNAKRVADHIQPGSFATLTREWRSGDRIELELPRALEIKPVDAYHAEMAALVYGPLVLFAIASDTPRVTRQQLLAAKRPSVESEEWIVGTASGPLRFLPWWAIQDEQYATYLTVT